MTKISPSILAADLLHIKKEIVNIDNAGADYVHIDIMDGHFVPNISFGCNMVKHIRSITNKILDVHLMISPVSQYIDEFINAGSDIISFHPEADVKTDEIIDKIKSSNCKLGIAINPNMKIETIKKYLSQIDLVIVMTVIPGFGGQKFLNEQIYKIKKLKDLKSQMNLNFEIEIDGGINIDTFQECIDNGADVLVAGSYIFKKPATEYKKLIDSLR